MTITAEQAAKLLDRVPEFADILRKQGSLSRDHHLSSNLHNAADWMDYLARALIASEAARKLAEERLAKANAAFGMSILRCAQCGARPSVTRR